MALASSIEIYNSVYKLAEFIFPLTRKFPKDVKPTLARRMEDCLLDMADRAMESYLIKDSDKKLQLTFSIRLLYEKLQFLVNLCVKEKYLSIGQQAEISLRMVKISNMLEKESSK